jgi:hypothetical protein
MLVPPRTMIFFLRDTNQGSAASWPSLKKSLARGGCRGGGQSRQGRRRLFASVRVIRRAMAGGSPCCHPVREEILSFAAHDVSPGYRSGFAGVARM